MGRRKSSQTGSYAPNLHEGKRSEYLAQYFFSSLGTAVPVPSPEDTGIDLHCTIARTIGKRAWPLCFYTVQVKSGMAPWVFESQESVKWIATQQFPIFLCVVEKKEGRFRLYQTLVRHQLHAHPPLPARMELRPEDLTEGKSVQWKRSMTSMSLSAPILDFGLDKFLDESFVLSAKLIIADWSLLDYENTHMRQSGMFHAEMPTSYKTNESMNSMGTMGGGIIPKGDSLRGSLDTVTTLLRWIAGCICHAGDKGLAVRMLLLLRRLNDDATAESFVVLRELCSHFGLPVPVHMDSYTAGLDRIDAVIEQMLPETWRLGNLLPISEVARRLRQSKGKLKTAKSNPDAAPSP